MRFLQSIAPAVLLSLLLTSSVRAQGGLTLPPTGANIDYFNGENIVTNFFRGSGGYINTGAGEDSPGINATITNSNDPSGQGGNAIIVTPVADPVIRFSDITFFNGTGAPIESILLTLPNVGRTDLGFIDDGDTVGVGSGFPFQFEYLDLIGDYVGDYPTYSGTGLKTYSTLHFFRGSGNARIGANGFGRFSFTATYPAPSINNNNTFLTGTLPSANGGSLTSVTPEAPGVVQLVAGLLPVAGVFGWRRRRSARQG